MWEMIEGECLPALIDLPANSFDAVITDPPYSSGGFSRYDKNRSTTDKYQTTGTRRRYPDFSGDNRDQRSYLAWSSLWIAECMRVLKPGGYFLAFTDWRQLPVMTDAVQAGGVFWRGLVTWDKGRGARAPHCGYFRHQCEFVVWGTKGQPSQDADGPWDGCMRHPVLQADKFHMTGKPTALMRELAQVVPAGGRILDPFAGSGSTGVGALLEGRRFVGIEREAAYADISRQRLQQAAQQAQEEITA